jgi:glycosyltransferase involved in cell wall biosynthesis
VERIRFTAERSDVGNFLALADLFVSASHEEGLSNALLEGMMAGLPIVATDVGAHRDALEGGVAGVLVPPRNPDELAAGIGRLVDDAGLGQKLGEAAVRRARAAFSLDAAARSLSDCLRSVDTRRKAASAS